MHRSHFLSRLYYPPVDPLRYDVQCQCRSCIERLHIAREQQAIAASQESFELEERKRKLEADKEAARKREAEREARRAELEAAEKKRAAEAAAAAAAVGSNYSVMHLRDLNAACAARGLMPSQVFDRDSLITCLLDADEALAKKLSLEDSERLKEERELMHYRQSLYGMRERKEIAGDGNCQFAALADQLELVCGWRVSHEEVRARCVAWLRANPSFRPHGDSVDLSAFLVEDIDHSWNDYCDRMARPGVWGDQMTLIAAAQVYSVRIIILSNVKLPETGNAEPITQIDPSPVPPDCRTLHLCHFLEVHYGSLESRPESPQPTRHQLE